MIKLKLPGFVMTVLSYLIAKLVMFINTTAIPKPNTGAFHVRADISRKAISVKRLQLLLFVLMVKFYGKTLKLMFILVYPDILIVPLTPLD